MKEIVLFSWVNFHEIEFKLVSPSWISLAKDSRPLLSLESPERILPNLGPSTLTFSEDEWSTHCEDKRAGDSSAFMYSSIDVSQFLLHS